MLDSSNMFVTELGLLVQCVSHLTQLPSPGITCVDKAVLTF